MKVSIARLQDAKAITDILNQTARLLTDKNIRQWTSGFTLAEIEAEIQNGRVYQVLHWGRVVAVFSLKDSGYFWPTAARVPNAMYFYRFAIAEGGIGKGQGTPVYKIIEQYIYRQLRASAIRLDCWAGNDFLKSFYQANGFTCQGDFPEEDYFISLYEKQLKI